MDGGYGFTRGHDVAGVASEVASERESRSERTLLTALLLSAPGPIVTGISAITGHSTTLTADSLRRSTELVAVYVSWWVYRKLRRGGLDDPGDTARRAKLEGLASICVGGAMACSGLVTLALAAHRLSVYEANGSVTLGLIIAVLGLVTNVWFWLRYRALAREQFNAVIAAQQRLYAAKSIVDSCVVAALAAVAAAPVHPLTRYVDIIGSVVVACYLLWNGFSAMRKRRGATPRSCVTA